MLKVIVYVTLLILVSVPEGYAQRVSGTIRNAKGEPVSYVTIVHSESGKGVYSNIDGSFRILLKPGVQSLVFQSIEYKQLVLKIEVNNDTSGLDVVLEPQSYALKEFSVKSNNEDPATRIMRLAIASAPYYNRQVLLYKAIVYVKGTGRVDESSWVFRKLLKNNKIEVGKTYVTESLNELEFRQPDTYKERVISLRSSMPFDNAPAPMKMARGSLYQADDGSDHVSVLSARAFTFYTFTYEGYFYDYGMRINKIRFSPKKAGNGLSDGILFIVEDLWCIHSCVVNSYETGFKYTVKASSKPLTSYPYVWMPVTYDISVSGDYLGVKGSFRYLASLTDYSIHLNPNVDHLSRMVVTKNAVSKGESGQINKSRNQVRIDSLMRKPNPSRKEQLELISRMKKEMEQAEALRPVINDSSELIIDSLALKRDTTFWNLNRQVQLLDEEAQSLNSVDSLLRSIPDSVLFSRKQKFYLSNLIGGDSLLFNRGKVYLAWKPLYKQVSLNTVEGWAIGAKFQFGNTSYRNWSFSQNVRFTPERGGMQFYSTFGFHFSPLNLGEVSVGGGSEITDFNRNGISRFTDAFQLLLFGNNFSRFYRKESVRFLIQYELVNGVYCSGNIEAANRSGLENINRYSAKQSNRADGNLNQMLTTNSVQYMVGIRLTPYQKYKLKNNVKYQLKSDWPVAEIFFRQSILKESAFTRIDAAVSHSFKLPSRIKLNANIQGGLFLDESGLQLPDRFYYAANQSWFYDGTALNRFQNLPYYSYSGSGKYVSGFVQAEFKRLLFLNLPYLNLTDLKEQLYLNALVSSGNSTYTEAGYKLVNIISRFGVGFNVSFISGKYQSTGVILNYVFPYH